MRCRPAYPFTVAKARSWRSAIDDAPAYQRGGDAWSLDQRQRFIDSLLNGYDVPKIYLHDLRGVHPTKIYAVVDGKQRLTATWSFLADEFPLAASFRVASVPAEDIPVGAVTPSGALRFSEMDPHWQRLLLQTHLSVVLIRDASEADIDELFARLNDGTPLTAPERRNAIAGDMSELVREVAGSASLAAILSFPDQRGGYRDVAVASLALAAAASPQLRHEPDLSTTGLDGFVRTNRRLDVERRQAFLDGSSRRIAAVQAALQAGAPALTDVPSAVAALRAGQDRGAIGVAAGDPWRVDPAR